ncbi:MAG TPA: ABC transporter permease [Thermoplasmata archaeon]|nr:ABC transporter permease [Thermoplasmata archaeon]
MTVTRRRPLRHRRTQQALAVAALATAVALPVVLLSVGAGVDRHEIAALNTSGFQITVSSTGVHGIDGAHHLATRIDGVAHVAAASPILSIPIDVEVRAGSYVPVLAEGVLPGAFAATEGPAERPLFPADLALGDPTDLTHYANATYTGPAVWSVLISSPLAQSYGLAPGQELTLAPGSNVTGAVRFNITGAFGVPPSLLGPTAAFVAVLPLSDLQLLVGLAHGGPTGAVVLDAADTVQVALAGAASSDPSAVRTAAAAIAALAPYYDVSAQLDQVNSIASAEGVLNGFYLALSSVGLVVGLVFLALVLARKVETERPEIGVRRAIGVPPSRIVGQVVGEGVGLAIGGSVAGIALGWGVVALLAEYGSGTVQRVAQLATFDPLTLVSLAASVVALGAVAGLFPARSALRLSIPLVLR